MSGPGGDDVVLASVRQAMVIVGGALIVAAGIAIHGVLPRHEWRPVTPDGRTIVVHDRWTGRFQRVTFDENGKVQLSEVYVGP